VGILWYTQPYRGLSNVSDEMRARTVVEAVVSDDGGLSYSGPFNLTSGTSTDPSDPAIGTYFHPCQWLVSSPSGCSSSGYFGEYISGTFLLPTTTNLSMVGTWGDSREGCQKQGLPTTHQHVWAGRITPQLAPKCGGQGEACCSNSVCKSELKCVDNRCELAINPCSRCQDDTQACLTACNGDATCECECQNQLCRCQLSSGCVPRTKMCSVEQC
jgi:hypothetical protein